MKHKAYEIFVGSSREVEIKVKSALAVDWELYGPPFISASGFIYQAVVLPAAKDDVNTELLIALKASLWALENQKAADDGYSVHENQMTMARAAIAKAESKYETHEMRRKC